MERAESPKKGLVAIAEEGSTAHLLARASSPASQLWGKGWAPEEVIVECDVELRLGAVAGFEEPLTLSFRGALYAMKPSKSGTAGMGLRGMPRVPTARGDLYKVPPHRAGRGLAVPRRAAPHAPPLLPHPPPRSGADGPSTRKLACWSPSTLSTSSLAPTRSGASKVCSDSLRRVRSWACHT
jgi:hypothetical protein